jgi:hypothetical protein
MFHKQLLLVNTKHLNADILSFTTLLIPAIIYLLYWMSLLCFESVYKVKFVMLLHCIGQFESISRCTSTLSTTKIMADCHVVVRGKVDWLKAEGPRLIKGRRSIEDRSAKGTTTKKE